MKILVVDDDSSVRDMVSAILTRAKHEPILAADGEEGLEKLKQAGPVDRIYTDYRMPIMNGLSMIRLIRRQDPTVFICLASGDMCDDLAANALLIGANSTVSKPFQSASDLLTSLNL